jgi:hypothetical protein
VSGLPRRAAARRSGGRLLELDAGPVQQSDRLRHPGAEARDPVAAHVDAVGARLAQVGAAEVAAQELGAREVAAPEAGVDQRAALEQRLVDRAPFEATAAQVEPFEAREVEDRVLEVDLEPVVRVAERRRPVHPDHVGVLDGDPEEGAARDVDEPQVRAEEVGVDEPAADQARLVQVAAVEDAVVEGRALEDAGDLQVAEGPVAVGPAVAERRLGHEVPIPPAYTRAPCGSAPRVARGR